MQATEAHPPARTLVMVRTGASVVEMKAPAVARAPSHSILIDGRGKRAGDGVVRKDQFRRGQARFSLPPQFVEDFRSRGSSHVRPHIRIHDEWSWGPMIVEERSGAVRVPVRFAQIHVDAAREE